MNSSALDYMFGVSVSVELHIILSLTDITYIVVLSQGISR